MSRKHERLFTRYERTHGLFRGRSGAVTLADYWVTRDEASTSILIYGEIIERLKGWYNYSEKRSELRQVLNQQVPIWRITYPILERYADIRRALRPQGGGAGSFMLSDVDALIAATAMEHGLTLVTADGDFLRVQGLAIKHVAVASLR